MNHDDIERSFGFLLHDSARLLRRAFDRRARALGLTRAQWSVLAHLFCHEGLKQAALADIMEVEPITLARLLDKLEAAGWVERRRDGADRRVRTVFLTEQARPIIAELRLVGAEVREVALAGLGEAQREALIDLLVRVRANLSEKDGQAAVVVRALG